MSSQETKLDLRGSQKTNIRWRRQFDCLRESGASSESTWKPPPPHYNYQFGYLCLTQDTKMLKHTTCFRLISGCRRPSSVSSLNSSAPLWDSCCSCAAGITLSFDLRSLILLPHAGKKKKKKGFGPQTRQALQPICTKPRYSFATAGSRLRDCCSGFAGKPYVSGRPRSCRAKKTRKKKKRSSFSVSACYLHHNLEFCFVFFLN